jgi:hypothetical protein
MCQGFDVMLLQLETATHMLFMFYCFSYFVDKVDMVGTIAGDYSRSLSMLPIPIADLNQQLSCNFRPVQDLVRCCACRSYEL